MTAGYMFGLHRSVLFKRLIELILSKCCQEKKNKKRGKTKTAEVQQAGLAQPFTKVRNCVRFFASLGVTLKKKKKEIAFRGTVFEDGSA